MALAGTASVASAQDPDTGGFSPDSATEPAAMRVAAPPTADVYGATAPRVKRFACRTACVSVGTARPGSLVRVYGKGLKNLGEVLFFGVDTDEADDAAVAPRKVGRRSVLVRVPRAAVTGRIGLRRVDGTRSPASKGTLTIAPGRRVAARRRRRRRGAGAEGLLRLAQARLAVLRRRRRRGRATSTSSCCAAGDGAVVTSWSEQAVEPGAPQTVEWDGTVRGKVARQGLYRFAVTATDAPASAPRRRSPRRTDRGRGARRLPLPQVPLPDHGRARLRRVAAAFGGGRGHQGQDVFAECGTPLVAARGGTVDFEQYQSRAGNYVVIDGARTGVDYAYMHLRDPRSWTRATRSRPAS